MSLMKSFSQLLSPLSYISQTLQRNRDQKELSSCSEKEWQEVSEKDFESGFSRYIPSSERNSMNFGLVRNQRVYKEKTTAKSVRTFDQSSPKRGQG